MRTKALEVPQHIIRYQSGINYHLLAVAGVYITQAPTETISQSLSK